MSNTSLLPLIYLYTANRQAIEGATRFQKIVFLGQEEEESIPEIYPYHADKYGPYSPQLRTDLEALEDGGYLSISVEENKYGHEKHIYTIKTRGIEEVRGLLGEETRNLFNAVQDIKKEYNQQRLDFLLRLVYRKYEEYTTETEFDFDRLFDPDTESPFVDVETREYLGPGPGTWKVTNSRAEELFSVD